MISPSSNLGPSAPEESAYDAAAAGRLPQWAVVSDARRGHIQRVADLMDEWAVNLELPDAGRRRWRAAAWLHDSLRDADPEVLRRVAAESFAGLPGPLLHGPAVATLLEREGVSDQGLLLAIGYHTIGHPGFDAMGRALYLADFLDPGRDFEIDWRNALRVRMPADMDAILVDVAAARMRHLIEDKRSIRPETAIFWNSLVSA
jgi:2-amino-4-hydroxy-6-hydroxymethyldihydropteridine diphosphokinase